MYLRGPERYNPVLEEWLPYYWPDILDASLDLSGHVIHLRENSLCMVPQRDGVYIYHAFSTTVGASLKPVGGRWHHRRYPVEAFEQLSQHTFATTLSNFLNFRTGQRCRAVLRIQFTPAAARRLEVAIH